MVWCAREEEDLYQSCFLSVKPQLPLNNTPSFSDHYLDLWNDVTLFGVDFVRSLFSLFSILVLEWNFHGSETTFLSERKKRLNMKKKIEKKENRNCFQQKNPRKKEWQNLVALYY